MSDKVKYILLAVLVIIILALIIFGKKIFKPSILKCIEANAGKEDGESCSACSPVGVAGIIINGRCFAIPDQFIYAQSGFRHYKKDGKYFAASVLGTSNDIETEQDYITAYKKFITHLPKEITQSI